MKAQLEALVSQMVDRGIRLEEGVEEFEKEFIQAALDGHNGNHSRAAHALGIHRNTLSRKMQKLHLGTAVRGRRRKAALAAAAGNGKKTA